MSLEARKARLSYQNSPTGAELVRSACAAPRTVPVSSFLQAPGPMGGLGFVRNQTALEPCLPLTVLEIARRCRAAEDDALCCDRWPRSYVHSTPYPKDHQSPPFDNPPHVPHRFPPDLLQQAPLIRLPEPVPRVQPLLRLYAQRLVPLFDHLRYLQARQLPAPPPPRAPRPVRQHLLIVRAHAHHRLDRVAFPALQTKRLFELLEHVARLNHLVEEVVVRRRRRQERLARRKRQRQHVGQVVEQRVDVRQVLHIRGVRRQEADETEQRPEELCPVVGQPRARARHVREDAQRDAYAERVQQYVEPPPQVVVDAIDHGVQQRGRQRPLPFCQGQVGLALAAEPNGGLALVAAEPLAYGAILDEQPEDGKAEVRVVCRPHGEVRVVEEIRCKRDVTGERLLLACLDRHRHKVNAKQLVGVGEVVGRE
ncbi:hypothetical protein VUR80DRAFT_2073 [Thermomyces stellatus]